MNKIKPILINYNPKYLPKTKILLSVWLHSFFKVCESCGKFNLSVKIDHRNTAYYEDHYNYVAFCDSCRDEDWNAFQELWDDYYSSRF